MKVAYLFQLLTNWMNGLETGLADWDISRDAPYFGFEIRMHRINISMCG